MQVTQVAQAVKVALSPEQQDKEDSKQANAELLREHSKSGIRHDSWTDINEQAERDTSLELAATECECYGDKPSTERYQVILKARRKADKILETYTFNNGIPFYFQRYVPYWSRTRWDLVVVYNNSELVAKAYTAQEAKAQERVIRRKHNREHEQAYIVLHEENTVTCEKTGISFTCKLPIPAAGQASRAINLTISHPLSMYDNVQEVIRQYYRTGIRLERELQPQVLAGMLITILKHKSLLIECKDIPRANMFLSAATAQTLAYAVRYFHNLPSTINMPCLSLNLADSDVIKGILKRTVLTSNQRATQEAELFLLNYISACKGDSISKDTNYIKVAPKSKTVKVRIFSDPVTQEHKKLATTTKDAATLIDALSKQGEHKQQHAAMFTYLRGQLKMLSFMSDKAKSGIAATINKTFPNNPLAVQLANVFKSADTHSIENDLFTFSQQLEREKQEQEQGKGTKVKVDFMSILNKKFGTQEQKD